MVIVIFLIWVCIGLVFYVDLLILVVVVCYFLSVLIMVSVKGVW